MTTKTPKKAKHCDRPWVKHFKKYIKQKKLGTPAQRLKVASRHYKKQVRRCGRKPKRYSRKKE